MLTYDQIYKLPFTPRTMWAVSNLVQTASSDIQNAT